MRPIDSSHPRSSSQARFFGLLTVLITTAVFCGVALWQGWIHPDSLQRLVQSTGAYGMLTYVVAVVLFELLWLPRMWGLVTGGLLFGPLLGTGLSIVADLIAAAVAFYLARFSGRDWARALLQRHAKTEQVVRLLTIHQGTLTIALLRMCPVAHYGVVNVAAGVLGVPPASFFLGTSIGIVPGALLYTWFGSALLSPGSPVFWTTLGLFLLATGVSIWGGKRYLRAAATEPSLDQSEGNRS